jgi:hypothetical protein
MYLLAMTILINLTHRFLRYDNPGKYIRQKSYSCSEQKYNPDDPDQYRIQVEIVTHSTADTSQDAVFA